MRFNKKKYREKNEMFAKTSAEIKLFLSLPVQFTKMSIVINMFCHPVRVLEPP